MLQRLFSSNIYLCPALCSRSCASRVDKRRPLYSTITVAFAIAMLANRPSPVRERPTRKSLLRGMRRAFLAPDIVDAILRGRTAGARTLAGPGLVQGKMDFGQ